MLTAALSSEQKVWPYGKELRIRAWMMEQKFSRAEAAATPSQMPLIPSSGCYPMPNCWTWFWETPLGCKKPHMEQAGGNGWTLWQAEALSCSFWFQPFTSETRREVTAAGPWVKSSQSLCKYWGFRRMNLHQTALHWGGGKRNTRFSEQLWTCLNRPEIARS